MKIYEERKIPAETKSVQVGRKCDLCGAEVRTPQYWSWTTETFNVAETKVECRTGTQYPEGGSGTVTEVDICTLCFRDRLVPWLESQGATVEEREWDS
jgi:hypothetical protein